MIFGWSPACFLHPQPRVRSALKGAGAASPWMTWGFFASAVTGLPSVGSWLSFSPSPSWCRCHTAASGGSAAVAGCVRAPSLTSTYHRRGWQKTFRRSLFTAHKKLFQPIPSFTRRSSEGEAMEGKPTTSFTSSPLGWASGLDSANASGPIQSVGDWRSQTDRVRDRV